MQDTKQVAESAEAPKVPSIRWLQYTREITVDGKIQMSTAPLTRYLLDGEEGKRPFGTRPFRVGKQGLWIDGIPWTLYRSMGAIKDVPLEKFIDPTVDIHLGQDIDMDDDSRYALMYVWTRRNGIIYTTPGKSTSMFHLYTLRQLLAIYTWERVLDFRIIHDPAWMVTFASGLLFAIRQQQGPLNGDDKKAVREWVQVVIPTMPWQLEDAKFTIVQVLLCKLAEASDMDMSKVEAFNLQLVSAGLRGPTDMRTFVLQHLDHPIVRRWTEAHWRTLKRSYASARAACPQPSDVEKHKIQSIAAMAIYFAETFQLPIRNATSDDAKLKGTETPPFDLFIMHRRQEMLDAGQTILPSGSIEADTQYRQLVSQWSRMTDDEKLFFKTQAQHLQQRIDSAQDLEDMQRDAQQAQCSLQQRSSQVAQMFYALSAQFNTAAKDTSLIDAWTSELAPKKTPASSTKHDTIP